MTSKVLPALHSIKSLPPEFKLTSGLMENRGDARLRSSDAIGSDSSENDAPIGKVSEESRNHAGDMGLYDEDLAYSRKGDSLSNAHEDLESVTLPFSSISSSLRERRWSDTTPYASKKVLFDFDFNLISCWISKVHKDFCCLILVV